MYYYVIICVICAMLGFLVGYLAAIDYSVKILKREQERHTENLKEAEYAFHKGLKDIGKIYRTEQQETAKRHTKLLDEIAQVTGVDVVELPSFGTVYLNHSKNLREAMQALHLEDFSDGALE